MPVFTSDLSIPLLGMARVDVLAVVNSSLTEGGCVRCVTPQAQWPGEPVEHVSVVVRFTAGSEAAAREIAEELHEDAMRAVYALVPPDGPGAGLDERVRAPRACVGLIRGLPV